MHADLNPLKAQMARVSVLGTEDGGALSQPGLPTAS